MDTQKIDINKIKLNPNNPRILKDDKFKKLVKSIKDFPEMLNIRPLVLNKDNVILWWNMRFKACKEAGLKEIPVIIADNLTEEQEKEFIIKDNASFGEWNFEELAKEWNDLPLEDWWLDIKFETVEEPEAEEDDFEVDEWIKTDIVKGDLFEIWEHRLLCWNSTNIDDVNKLMNGEKADLWYNDPPYWMKLENKGVEWDNINYDDLLQFNKDWISLQFWYLKDNWSFYCWGIDEPLMDIYSNILKPYIKEQKATFRNLITWDKWHGQGQNSENTRSYAIADEKCLFAMCGVQGFNNNADNYFEGWESIRIYLELEIKKLNESDGKIAIALGYKDGRTVNHWWSKSQWSLPTQDNYFSLKEYAKSKNINAFKKEYDELKKEYYSTRAYFNNTHDNFNNVWKFDRTSNEERAETWWHYTPKPIALCSRWIKSSSPENGLVIDFFLWSGSTMVASHQSKRRCYWIEMQPKYVQTIINRMIKLAPELEIKRNWQPYELQT